MHLPGGSVVRAAGFLKFYNMKVLIACEFSGVVRDAFIQKGHDAISCDLLPTERPGSHYQGNVLDIINDGFDLMIAHPPCTFFSRAGIQFIHKQPDRMEKLRTSFEFVKQLYDAPIKKKCIENPAGWLCTNWKRPTQIIHPWYFGDDEMKETCLWLTGLPRLCGLTEVATHKELFKPIPAGSRIGSDGKMKNKYFMSRMTNAKDRSRTFPGIAYAMASQWG